MDGHEEEQMPLVEISMLTGRDAETKEKIIREVTDAVVRTSGAPPEAVTVIIRDVPGTDWARAGKPYSKAEDGK
ncbi:MAG: 4-oxalocrotonate tautomerase family protein [Candidatus Eisenbacteria bacterium]|nr:4-oxalocrotonate tautomerase family protein [Candidatus Eisenbacteria bacterium]